MKYAVILAFCAIAFVTSGVQSIKSYKNHKVVVASIVNKNQLKEIQSLELQSGVRRLKI
jgi:hypothetical protein